MAYGDLTASGQGSFVSGYAYGYASVQPPKTQSPELDKIEVENVQFMSDGSVLRRTAGRPDSTPGFLLTVSITSPGLTSSYFFVFKDFSFIIAAVAGSRIYLDYSNSGAEQQDILHRYNLQMIEAIKAHVEDSTSGEEIKSEAEIPGPTHRALDLD